MVDNIFIPLSRIGKTSNLEYLSRHTLINNLFIMNVLNLYYLYECKHFIVLKKFTVIYF